MKATLSPLIDGLSPIHRRMPPDLETLHKGFEKFEIDDIIFDDEDVDWRYGSVQKAAW